MSHELERAALEKFFLQTAWNPTWGDPNRYVALQNISFETPTNHLFAVYSIVDRGSIRMSLGRDYIKRNMASVQVDIYTPLDQGTKQSREMADIWEGLYDMKEVLLTDGELVRFETPSSRVLDPNVIRAANLDDNWDRFMFEAPYYRDSRVSK